MTSDHGAVPPRDTQVTRLLCATTHLQGSYAERVADSMLDPSFVASAPSWGVDLVALTRHAALAVQRRRSRDKALRVILYVTVLLGLFSIVAWPLGWLSPFASIQATLLVALLGWLIAWWQVFQHYDDVRRSSLMAMNPKLHLRDQAPALADSPELLEVLELQRQQRVPQAQRVKSIEERLEDLATSNVVVFGGHIPFVGEGHPLDTWTMSFDLEPAQSWSGEPRDLPSISVHDLYDRLFAEMPSAFPGMTCGTRLYVNGTAAKNIPGLVPDPMVPETRPGSHIPEEIVEQFVDGATETARTYAWFSTAAWGEEIRLTVLLRAMITGDPRDHAVAEPAGPSTRRDEVEVVLEEAGVGVRSTTGAAGGEDIVDAELLEDDGRTPDDTLVDPGWPADPRGPRRDDDPETPAPVTPDGTGKQRLFIEGRTHVLLPVQPVFRDVKFVPNNPRRAWLVVAKPATANATGLWLSSVSRHVDHRYRVWKMSRQVERRRRDLVDGVNPLNYGAQPSLREEVAEANELKYYATVDEVQRFIVMTRTVMDGIRSFLQDQHVDLIQFTGQSEGIVKQAHVWLHPVQGSSGSFGRSTTVTI